MAEMIFGIFPVIFLVVFVSIFAMVIYTFVRQAAVWNKNNHSPRLTVEAVAVAKRSAVSSHTHMHDSAMPHTTHTTSYYVTFQVDSGDRIEFMLPGSEYGMIVEGDRGRLSFQGSRFISFQRI